MLSRKRTINGREMLVCAVSSFVGTPSPLLRLTDYSGTHGQKLCPSAGSCPFDSVWGNELSDCCLIGLTSRQRAYDLSVSR